jgi:hypothetical protein
LTRRTREPLGITTQSRNQIRTTAPSGKSSVATGETEYETPPDLNEHQWHYSPG